MRTCPRCMAENSDSARFCRQCASPLQQSAGKTCPSGRHTMDPTWTECAYCKQENVAPLPPSMLPARQSTVVEGGPMPPRGGQRRPFNYQENTPLPPRPPRPVSPAAGAAQPSNPAVPPPVATPPMPSRPRPRTEYRPLSDPAQTPVPTTDSGRTAPAAPNAAVSRKIVGLLITYSWIPEGQVFPIREGRNYIGHDQDCDVCVPEDQTMSGRNTHITFRQNFVIGDLVSMTGTDVDNVPIEEQFRSLTNYSTIRAGSTYFTFIAIKQSA